MKELTHCPLCGMQYTDVTSQQQCKFCGAKEYRIPMTDIFIGYLYPSEYKQYIKLGKIIVALVIIALAVWYIGNWLIASTYPNEVTISLLA